MKISVVISAYNEEKKIKDCLESVKWADEVIVVDGMSADSTAAIAKKHGAKVYTRENNLMLNVNKNFGFGKATNDWILSLDADERITPELKEEINSLSAEARALDGQVSGYWIPRKNIIFGKWIEHTGWYPDHQLRLFRKGHGRFDEKHIHEMINLKGEAGYLKNHFIHYNYETVAQFLHKTMVIYAPNEASEKLRKGYVFNHMDFIRFPLSEFLKRFFAGKGYKDGFHGLMLSMLMGFYHFVIFLYIWEKKNFVEPEDKNFPHYLKEELKKSKKELTYWIDSRKIEQEKNMLKKSALKIKRKLRI